MKKNLQKSLFAVMFLSCTLSMAEDYSATKSPQNPVYDAGVEAYIYTYPLVITGATALVGTNTDKPLPNGHAPFNQFGNASKLFTAADKDVVSTNVDNLYSSAMLDLKQGAALISVPEVNHRYYSMMLTDAYTNVFDYIGSRSTGTHAGKYLITGPNWKGKVPVGVKKVFKSPTSFVWIIGRTAVKSQSDVSNVVAIQKQYKIEIIPPALDKTPIKQRWNLTLQPKLVPVQQVDAMDWKTYYNWAGQLMRDNPPPAKQAAVYDKFKAIGLTVENGFDVNKLSLEDQATLAKAYDEGKAEVKKEAQNTGSTEVNGWAYNLNAGQWGENYKLRAGIAYRSLGQNTAAEALYMNTRQDMTKAVLNGSKNYTITFKKGETPPVDAFWSITMYNSHDFFVDNPINRYAIGSNAEGLKYAKDGSLVLYVQKDAPASADQKANWLPAPDGDFRLSMRLYNPKKAILDGKWVPPGVVAQ